MSNVKAIRAKDKSVEPPSDTQGFVAEMKKVTIAQYDMWK